MKPNLVDKTCELCNYRKLHNTTTREQFWQYSLLLLTKPQLRCGQMEFEGGDQIYDLHFYNNKNKAVINKSVAIYPAAGKEKS